MDTSNLLPKCRVFCTGHSISIDGDGAPLIPHPLKDSPLQPTKLPLSPAAKRIITCPLPVTVACLRTRNSYRRGKTSATKKWSTKESKPNPHMLFKSPSCCSLVLCGESSEQGVQIETQELMVCNEVYKQSKWTRQPAWEEMEFQLAHIFFRWKRCVFEK